MSARRARGKKKSPPPVDFLGESLNEMVMAALSERITEGVPPTEWDTIADGILTRMEKALPETIRASAVDMADSLDAATPKLLTHRRKQQREFEGRLRSLWGTGLDRLEAVLHGFLEIGQLFQQEGTRPDVPPPGPLFSALTQLHARACRVGLEILTLLEAGLADGAHARWRTLHEIAVVSLVLQESGDEMALRYLEHERVMRWKAAANFEKYVHLLGWEPTPPEELVKLKAHSDELIERYGRTFKSDYGWASGVNGNPQPNMPDLEAAASVSGWRPFAKWANDPVHAGPRGLISLGLSPDKGRPSILLAGASNAGLADPGQHTALTLVLIAAALLGDRPTLDRAAMVGALDEMAHRTQEAFMVAHSELERQHRAILAKKKPTRSPRKSRSQRKRPSLD
jgi:hypothetical protein